MGRSDATRYLVRAALDDDFRALAQRDADASFEGFDLTGDEKDVLRRQDAEMLRLLAFALEDAQTETAARPTVEATLPVAGSPVAVVDLVLQLNPLPSRDENGDLVLAHAASLHPDTGTLPSPPEGLPDGALPPVYFSVRISPLVVDQDSDALRLGYAAAIVPMGAEIPTAPASQWGHRVDAPDAKAAADAVKKAAPDERYDRLLDLIAALKAAP